MTKPFNKHAQYSELTADVSPAEMPFLSEVYASVKPEEPDPQDPIETRTGLAGAVKRDFVSSGRARDAFYGVARSWVGWNSEAKEGSGPQRFDFRHGSGYINVIFLDGHVDSIKQDDTARLRALHDAWNRDSVGAP